MSCRDAGPTSASMKALPGNDHYSPEKLEKNGCNFTGVQKIVSLELMP